MMHMCVYVRVYVSEHDIFQVLRLIKLKFGINITGPHRTNAIGFGECTIFSFFFLQEYKKEFLHIMAYGIKFLNVF